jgi:hypothetical protein
VQGASALQGVLEKVDGPVDVFAVWEPVLPTDLLPPGTRTLSRLRDARAWQVWDRSHVMSDALRAGMVAHPSKIPLSAERRGGRVEGVLWDAVALFPPGARWEDSLPAPAYLDGDVVDVTGAVAERLQEMLHQP